MLLRIHTVPTLPRPPTYSHLFHGATHGTQLSFTLKDGQIGAHVQSDTYTCTGWGDSHEQATQQLHRKCDSRHKGYALYMLFRLKMAEA